MLFLFLNISVHFQLRKLKWQWTRFERRGVNYKQIFEKEWKTGFRIDTNKYELGRLNEERGRLLVLLSADMYECNDEEWKQITN